MPAPDAGHTGDIQAPACPPVQVVVTCLTWEKAGAGHVPWEDCSRAVPPPPTKGFCVLHLLLSCSSQLTLLSTAGQGWPPQVPSPSQHLPLLCHLCFPSPHTRMCLTGLGRCPIPLLTRSHFTPHRTGPGLPQGQHHPLLESIHTCLLLGPGQGWSPSCTLLLPTSFPCLSLSAARGRGAGGLAQPCRAPSSVASEHYKWQGLLPGDFHTRVARPQGVLSYRTLSAQGREGEAPKLKACILSGPSWSHSQLAMRGYRDEREAGKARSLGQECLALGKCFPLILKK